MSYCKTSTCNLTLAIQVILACLLLLLPFSTPFDVRLYAQKQFEGKYTKIKITDTSSCVNLPSNWEKNVFSIDPLGCVMIYAEPDCHGLRRRLDRWSWGCANLKEISFEKRLSSMSPCPVAEKKRVHIVNSSEL